jgi:hypothetical protein
MEFSGSTSTEGKTLDWKRLGKQRAWSKNRGTQVLIYGTRKEIVAGDRGTYPKKFGKWRDSLNRTVAGSFGIQAESYSV